MATECAPLARGKLMRLTKLDACGAIVSGAGATLTTKGFVSITPTPNYLEAEEIVQADANGDRCISDRSEPDLRWIDLSIVLCLVDPGAINLMTGDPLVLDDALTPNTVGYRINADLTGSANFALETWSGITGQACAVGGFPKYGYWLFPWVKDAQWGEWSIANGALTTTLTARAVFGSQWGTGPYNVRRDAQVPATLEKLLTAIGPVDAMHYEVSSAPLPTPACGTTTLVPVP